ncbi:MAG: ThiS family protein, partial [Desulfobacteraceae bacterium]|nr:ThiS family protein [Desulfobacteraceae bacterium]
MGIKLNIHKTHRQYTNGLETIDTEGTTVGDCLEMLIELFPRIKGALFDRNGRLKKQIDIYLNSESAYPDELKKKV